MKYEDLHCICGQGAQEHYGVPLQIGLIHFCSLECMRDYINAELDKMLLRNRGKNET
jgi:hypothetical protein